MKSYSEPERAGVALVIVLSFLVLISVIILAFFSSVSNELTSSKAAANSANVQQLSDSAVNVVMAQIVDATKAQTSSTWASQPGMIRTYGNSASPGSPQAFFKLYSSDALVANAGPGGFDPTDDLDGQWDLKPAQFTDLNSPAPDSGGKMHFPIIDPRAQTAPGTSVVDGFSYSDTAVGKTAVKMNLVNAGGSGANADDQRLPMPVKWIYVLKDGTLTAPTGVDGTTGKIANWTGAAADKTPSATNPIVGRIAFWTDDETCKVNINTASEGVYWDIPRVMSKEDYGVFQMSPIQPGLGWSQPAQNEFQRYPGHPACTSLSVIFGNANWNPQLFPVPAPYPANPTSTEAQKLDPYYNLVPRIGLPASGGSGGSKGGSYQVLLAAPTMTTDTERLYASVDELMFTQNLSGAARVPNTSTTSAPNTITKDVLEKTRFFLTASSSAPETTVFNTPRVAVWPVWSKSAMATGKTRTAYEKLLTFCSTIGDKPYYFTRANARSCTADYKLSPRNQELYAYLQRLTQKDIPGFGGNFLSKFPAGPGGATDRDQILTYIYDYIRCTNLQDKSSGASPFTPLFVVTNKGETPGAGEVLPIRIGQTQGFGRFSSVSSASLLFYATQKDAGGKTTQMRALFLLMPTSPTQGVAATRGNVKFKVISGLDALKANGVNLGFRPGGTNYFDANEIDTFGGRGLGGTETPYGLMCWTDPTGAQGTPTKSIRDADAGGDAHYKYPFVTVADAPVTGTGVNPSFIFSGGTVVVEIRGADTDELVQTLNFNFPPGQFRVPTYRANPSITAANPEPYFPPSARDSLTTLVNEDTVVAVEVGGHDLNANANTPGQATDASAGDIRMVAGLANVPADRYRAHFNYKDASVKRAHHMINGGGAALGGGLIRGTFGNLARGIPAGYPKWQPDVPSRVPQGVNGGVSRKDGGPGDWDTGWGDQKDGAYINKPDEADTQLSTGMPYTTGYKRGAESANSVYFSPNRMIPSPLMFGSIPTGVQRMLPWQTLLFHPRPEDPSHPGRTSPPDHLIADLFWMPVVQPYAISQPFSTSGKINLNYQIAPFTYINRATGIHAVMKSTKFAALPVSDLALYKETGGYANGSVVMPTFIPNRRRNIDMAKTLVAFEEKFKNNDLFRSASQICEVNLVPPEVTPAAATAAATETAMATFWNNNQLTGDNLREKPYVDLYSRLTTKSNTYTVHVRVQGLKKAPGTAPDQWVEGKDQVAAEYRGSSILERYIDLNDPTLPDFATDGTQNIDPYYKMRVISTKRFAP